MKPQRIILTGFMGTGKSTVGRLLAERLQWSFVDTDQALEAKTGRTVADIFENDGEPAFRQLEKEVLRDVLVTEPAVVATGGGAILDEENYQLMLRSGYLVALTARPELILERVRAAGERPLLKVADPMAEILRLIQARQASYDKAEYVIDTSVKSPEQIVQAIADWRERTDG